MVKTMIKKISLIIILAIFLIIFIILQNDLLLNQSDLSRLYFLQNTLNETSSENIVTGIYLDYRLFDSIFEASTLLIAVSGIIFITRNYEYTTDTFFIFDKHKASNILTHLSSILFPFLLVFGLYIITHGHLTPGGGFQGGAILATAVLTTYYINPGRAINTKYLVLIEKILFIALILISSISLITRNTFFTNFIPIDKNNSHRTLFLITLNLFIGLKVSFGLINIFTSFLREESKL